MLQPTISPADQAHSAQEAGDGPTLLGVARSLLGKAWYARDTDDRYALMLAQRLGLSEVTARVLVARGIDEERVQEFLEPRLRDLLPDPDHLKDMSKAADRIAQAIMAGEAIGVFGDYDVDGATSSALLSRFFNSVGGKAAVHIPDRLKEGYGPNAPAMLGLRDRDGVGLVITVDCGTLAFDALEAVADQGLEVIVIDHHTADVALPRAVAVVNPNRLDDPSPHGNLAAVGVAFLLCIAVNRVLRKSGWYQTRSEPDLRDWLDLVALGTVCDVVPLTGLNRALVVQGLKVMSGRGNAGLRALADVAGLDEAPSAYHLGFLLGPRVNAGGRVGEAPMGYRLLSTDHADEAWHLAQKLDRFNRERQEIEAAVLEDAIEQVEASDTSEKAAALVVAGEGWHPGVIGIVAGRIKDRYNRPACVIALDGPTGVGSGRSVPGVNLGQAIIAAAQSDLLIKGGGHAMAAGFTVPRDRLAAFQSFLDARIGEQVAASGLVPSMRLDGSISPDGATLALARELARLGPFGPGNAEPRFVIPAARLSYADTVGTGHVRASIEKEAGGTLNAIAFRVGDTPLGPALLNSQGRPIHLAGKVRLNSWQGRTSVQFQIEDAAWA